MKKLLLNSLSSTALYVVNVAVAFIMSPVYIRALGNRDFGLWELIISVVGYMGLLDLGIGTALVRFVSVADANEDREDLQQTISTSFAFFVIVAVLSLILFVLLSYYPWIIAGKESETIPYLGSVFLLLGFNAALVFLLQVFTATLMGVQRHYFINSVRTALLIINAVVNYYLLQRFIGNGLMIMALVTPAITAIQLVLFAGAIYFDNRLPPLSMASVTISKAKQLMSFGGKTVIMMTASRLQNQTIPFIIGGVIGLGHIVYFVMPNRLIDYAKGLSQALGLPLTPYFGAAIGRGEQKEVIKSWLQTSMVLQIVSFAMPVIIAFCGEPFIFLWLGPDYAEKSKWVLYIMIGGLAADSVAGNSLRMLTAKGRHGKVAMVWLCLSILSIPFGVLGAYFWGVIGVTLSMTIVTIIGSLLSLYMACNIMQISLFDYYRETLLRLLLPLALLICSFSLLLVFVNLKSYAAIVLNISIAGVVYLCAIWFHTFNPDIRSYILTHVKSSR